MSILASPSPASTFIPAGYVEARCIGCGSAIVVPAGFDASPCCIACKRSHAEHEARRLLADVRDLANGTGVFADVPEEERREQCRQLILSTDDGKPAMKSPEQALADLIDVLPDTSVDVLADFVSRRIAERKRKPEGRAPTLVRVAIADLSDGALIDLVGETDDPILLNAASAELEGRLGRFTGEKPTPRYTQTAGATPDPATRYELEGRIEAVGEPVDPIGRRGAKAA
jgi:predicted Zn-dependent protease with MMP-like domain